MRTKRSKRWTYSREKYQLLLSEKVEGPGIKSSLTFSFIPMNTKLFVSVSQTKCKKLLKEKLDNKIFHLSHVQKINDCTYPSSRAPSPPSSSG